MRGSMILGLCAGATLLLCGHTFAAETPHTKVFKPQVLPQLYVGEKDAQAACPDDQVVWVNWSARKSHLPADKYYGHTVTGAYSCGKASALAGVKPGE